ncbi:MAG: FeoB small GTPase domain-containing protein [Anaerolineae bacterium]|jgi:ferrous iron transport protein B|nr:FeoB small GTPase domain-containing protein [Anaerolineae bacterium]
MAEATIALAGNPNVGKSTVFNALTGARQHVGNWPGKTVEKKEGSWAYQGKTYMVVDLPGTYSLTAFSMEEIIARDFIIDARPNVVVVVVDAANLERNLYLVVQIIEMGAPVIVALNMADLAETKGLKIDVEKLAQGLGVPVIPTIAREGEGLKALSDAIVAALAPKEESR